MKTKTQIINEINEVPEILEGLSRHSQSVYEETGIQIDPYDIGILLASFLGRFALRTIQSKAHEQTIIERFERMPLVKTILKKHPELDFHIETMIDPEIGVGKLAIGLDFLRKATLDRTQRQCYTAFHQSNKARQKR